jgi:hypothetical protein
MNSQTLHVEFWSQAGVAPSGALNAPGFAGLPGLDLPPNTRWALHVCFPGRYGCSVWFQLPNGAWSIEMPGQAGMPSAFTLPLYTSPGGHLGILVRSGAIVVPAGDQLGDAFTRMIGFGARAGTGSSTSNAVVILASIVF